MFNKNNERILAECLDQITKNTLSVDECVKKYPDIEEELRISLKIQKNFSEVSQNSPAENIRRQIKVKILRNLPDRDLVVTNRSKPRYTVHNLKRRFSMSWIIIISTILTLASGGGIVYASGDALPGEVLYPVKTWVEDLRLAVASDEADVGLQFKFAETRLAEIESLLLEGDLDDLDEAILGYGNQAQLMSQTMAKIKADNPDEAVRLRTDLETKLQDQARRMEDLLDESEESDAFVQERMRLMLQTNTQLRERINEEEEIPEDVDPGEGEVVDDESLLAASEEESVADEGPKQNGKEEISAEVDNEAGAFKFSIGDKGGNGVYAMIAGSRFECSVDGETAICPADGAPNKGEITLHDAKTHQLLFSFAYEHEFAYDHGWQGEKNDNGNNGSEGSTEGGSKESSQNNKGK